MDGRLMRLRRLGLVLALIVSVAVYAYAVTGIVTAGDDLRSAAKPRSSERQKPVSDHGCHDSRHERLRL
jgi:hypothetical protein